MSLEQQMKTGLLYCEYGHNSEQDKKYEQVIEQQRVHCKEMMFDYNHTRPKEVEKKAAILKDLLGSIGKNCWIEAPAHFAYGCNTHIGDYFYANFNMVVVDDGEVVIGNHVMFGPNVTLSVTGHPVYGEFRRDGTQFSLPIHIGDDVWVGSNTVILPGVTIGNNVVIGAGSVVTKDIPDNVVAFGAPCKVVREISDYDREYYRKDMKINWGWQE